MLWLDSIYPPEKEGQPGGARGDCPQDSGVPADVEANYPDAYVLHPHVWYPICLLFTARLFGPTFASDLLDLPSKRPSRYPNGNAHGEPQGYAIRLSTKRSKRSERSCSFRKTCIYQAKLHTPIQFNSFPLKRILNLLYSTLRLDEYKCMLTEDYSYMM